MNLLNLPVFILLFAIVYLTIVYGLLKMAEAQKRTGTTVPHNSGDSEGRIEAP